MRAIVPWIRYWQGKEGNSGKGVSSNEYDPNHRRTRQTRSSLRASLTRRRSWCSRRTRIRNCSSSGSGPRGLATTLKTFEPKSGGQWRFLQKDKDGQEYGFHGVFHEVSPQRMVQTFEYEGMPEGGHVSLDTLRLEALPKGRTRLTVKSVFQSVADRDGMVEAGMEHGVKEGYERLDELLEKK